MGIVKTLVGIAFWINEQKILRIACLINEENFVCITCSMNEQKFVKTACLTRSKVGWNGLLDK